MREEIITHPDDLASCCAELAKFPHFGFDTEFVGEDTYHPSLCLVQVATPECLYLIDPLTTGPLDAFWQLVVDPARTVVVHAGREEVRLCRLGTGSTPGNLFDLQLAAGLVGWAYPLGYGTLVNQVLGVQMAKGETLTEWRHRPLTSGQLRYAFDDVRYLLPVWQRLSARLEKQGRIEWRAEEFLRLTMNAARGGAGHGEMAQATRPRLIGPPPPSYRPRLVDWREETAALTNRPTRAIVRDDLIIEIARRNPSSERDLHVVRGLPRRDLEAILQTVTEARSLPTEQCPVICGREQDPSQVALISSVLTAVLGDLCARRSLAPNLVASNNDVKTLVRARLVGQPLPPETLLMGGWRGTHILPDLLDVLDGRRLVRISDVKADAPFDYTDGPRLS